MTQPRMDLARDQEVLKLMKESGCIGIFFGMESFGEESLKDANKSQNKAGGYAETIRALHRQGICVMAGFISGFDGDSPDRIRAMPRRLYEVGIDVPFLSILTPFPGTEAYDKMVAEDRMLNGRGWEFYNGYNITFQPKQMSPDVLLQAHRQLWREAFSFHYSLRRVIRSARYLRPGGLPDVPVHECFLLPETAARQRTHLFRSCHPAREDLCCLTQERNMRRIIFAAFIFFILLGASTPARADESLLVYYAGDTNSGVYSALELTGYTLVTDPPMGDVYVLNGVLPSDPVIRERIRSGEAGLVLILGETMTDSQAQELLGVPITFRTTNNAVSLTGLSGLDDPLLTEISWNSAPQIRERMATVTPLSSVQPLVATYPESEWVLWEALPKTFIFNAFLSEAANPQIQDWSYFNYLIYHLTSRAGGRPLSPLRTTRPARCPMRRNEISYGV